MVDPNFYITAEHHVVSLCWKDFSCFGLRCLHTKSIWTLKGIVKTVQTLRPRRGVERDGGRSGENRGNRGGESMKEGGGRRKGWWESRRKTLAPRFFSQLGDLFIFSCPLATRCSAGTHRTNPGRTVRTRRHWLYTDLGWGEGEEGKGLAGWGGHDWEVFWRRKGRDGGERADEQEVVVSGRAMSPHSPFLNCESNGKSERLSEWRRWEES